MIVFEDIWWKWPLLLNACKFSVVVAQSRSFHWRQSQDGLHKHMLCIGAVHRHLLHRLPLPGFSVVWFSPLSEGNVQDKFFVTQSLLVESCSETISPACYICGNSTQRRCCKTVSPQWDVIEWKQMVSWRKFQGRITFSSYCLFDFTVIVWWIVSDLILQIEKLLLNVLPNVQIK